MDEQSKRVEIIPAKRKAMILEWLRAHGPASIQELAGDLGASPSTIRRDLEDLTKAGYLERTHGGAQLRKRHATLEIESSISAHIDRSQKRAIGAEAAKRVKKGESVIFNSSSTVIEAVHTVIENGVSCTAVTNSLDIAQLCAYAPAIRLVILGGSVRAGTPQIVGDPGRDFLGKVHADLCLLGSYAITGGTFTDASLEVAAIKQAMIKASQRRIVLADSSKFRAPSFCTFCEASEIEEVITDDGSGADHIAVLRNLGVKVTIVPVNTSEREDDS